MPTKTAETLRMSNTLQVAAFQHKLGEPRLAVGAHEFLAGVEAVLAAFDAEIDVIWVDTKLTPEGKMDAADRSARTANAKLDAFANKVEDIDRRVADAARRLVDVPRPASDPGAQLVAELRAREVRDQFRAFNDIERDAAYLGITDGTIREALENAPPLLVRVRPGDLPVLQPMISPERVKQRRLADAEAKNPESAREIRDLETIVRVYAAAIATARREVAAVVPNHTATAIVMA